MHRGEFRFREKEETFPPSPSYLRIRNLCVINQHEITHCNEAHVKLATLQLYVMQKCF